MLLIIGNVIALIASLLMVYCGFLKNKKKILYIQSIQIGLFVASNIVLNGLSGVIINSTSLIRNILCYKNRLKLKEKIILTIVNIVLVLYFNNTGYIGYLPLISTLLYLWLMTVKDVKKFKLLIVFTLLLWSVYDFTIRSYTACFFDILTALAHMIILIKMYRKNR